MQTSCKSSTKLDSLLAVRPSRRESRGYRKSREWQFRISNPLHDVDTHNRLPTQVRAEMQKIQYISPNVIKNMQIAPSRRTSNIVKNLQMMQQLARRQEAKYTGMLDPNRVEERQKESQQEPETVMNLMEDEEFSLELQGFYERNDRIQEDFNMFLMEDNNMEMEQPIFYSSNELGENFMLEEEMNNYLVI